MITIFTLNILVLSNLMYHTASHEVPWIEKAESVLTVTVTGERPVRTDFS